MPGSGQLFDESALTQSLSDLQGVKTVLMDALDSARAQAQQLDQAWQSSLAAPDFQSALHKWHAQFEELNGDLDPIMQFIQTAIQRWGNAEKQSNVQP